MSGEDGELKILRNDLEEVRLYLQVKMASLLPG